MSRLKKTSSVIYSGKAVIREGLSRGPSETYEEEKENQSKQERYEYSFEHKNKGEARNRAEGCYARQ
ncbi:unnamed protein product, partial [Fusarium graminearum]